MALLKRQLKRILVLTLATIFLALGLAGLVLPVLQGWLFLTISLLLFSMYSPALRLWVDKHTIKYPRIHAFVAKAQAWTTKVFGAPEV
jgi:uncharacterized membrane protein YbaN (DUF454 family)